MDLQIAQNEWSWSMVVPVIASVIALLGVAWSVHIQRKNFSAQIRSSRALKIAEMRQIWINNLRDAMSKFQSYGTTPNLDQLLTREFYEHGTHIELMMNPGDPNYETLKDCLYRYLTAETMLEKYAVNPEYIDVCQKILKKEWETLKQEIMNIENGI